MFHNPACACSPNVRGNIMRTDIIVEILRYGKTKKPGKELGFVFDDISTYLKGLGFTMDLGDIHTLNIILDSCFILSQGLYVMKADGYFSLLEYEELEEARESSKHANKWATIALIVSIVATVCSIGFSLKQIYTPTEINQEQIDQITQTISRQDNLIDSLFKASKNHNCQINQADSCKAK